MKQAPIAALLLVSLFASPARAQTPDTTDAARYLPLEVGNVWEYEQWIEECQGTEFCNTYLAGYERWTVTGDSTVSDTTYALLDVAFFGEDGAGAGSETRLVRFDTVGVRGFQRNEDGTEFSWPAFIPCPLDAPTDGPPIACGDEPEPFYFVYADEALVTTPEGEALRSVKTYAGLIAWSEYVADVGLRSEGAAEFGGAWITLSYARVGAVEYGTEQFPAASEPAWSRPDLALSVFPNPAREAATVVVTLDQPQRAHLAVFDVLGRRVRTLDLGSQPAGEGRHRLDLDALAPGLYVVRLSGDAGVVETARIVRH